MTIDRAAAAQAIDAFLRAIGRDPAAEPELVGTGERVAEAFTNELCSGYAVDTEALVRRSVIEATSSDVVVARDLPIVTTCPHHLLPAMGTATIAMKAKGRIVGIGTLAALVDAHARRLTLQETIGASVVRDLSCALAPAWVACRLSLVHACMVARGERAVGSRVETTSISPDLDPELMAVVHGILEGGR